MDVECVVSAEGNKAPDDDTNHNNKYLVVRNGIGYHNVKLGIKQYINGEWVIDKFIAVDGTTLIKALNNAMNS